MIDASVMRKKGWEDSIL